MPTRGLVATAMRATTVAQAVVPSKRVVALAMVASLVALSLGAGGAAAHNPACKKPGGADSPHYGGGQASDTAYDHNPNLNSPDNEGSQHPDNAESIHNREGSCSVGKAGDGGGH